jgi:hypothetical protein
MKNIAGIICLASFCVGTIWVEYEAISRFSGAFILIAGTSALAVLSAELFRGQKGIRAPVDYMLGRVIGGSATPVMSDSLNGRCGENGHCERHPRTRARHETF